METAINTLAADLDDALGREHIAACLLDWYQGHPTTFAHHPQKGYNWVLAHRLPEGYATVEDLRPYQMAYAGLWYGPVPINWREVD